MRYAFGDTEIAARRLELLAQAFAETTRAFLLDAASERPRLAVDLGCGPGHTTHFLAGLLGCHHTAGLDNSARFLDLARTTQTPTVSFHLHDVTEAPFPVGPADLLYGRFLLTHLRDPRAVIARWATQLQPNGLLLMEETAWIRTANPTFATYLRIVEAMLAHQGNRLYAGADLDGLSAAGPLRPRISRLTRLPMQSHHAAGLFSLNIRTWKHHPFIQSLYPPATIERLAAELQTLAEQPARERGIEFGLRQVGCDMKKSFP